MMPNNYHFYDAIYDAKYLPICDAINIAFYYAKYLPICDAINIAFYYAKY